MVADEDQEKKISKTSPRSMNGYLKGYVLFLRRGRQTCKRRTSPIFPNMDLALVQLFCFFSPQSGESQIKISSTLPSNKLSIGATTHLACPARPFGNECFNPQDKRTGFKCRVGLPPAKLVKCTLEAGALTDGKLGNYACRARNGCNYFTTKRFQVGRQ